MGHIDERSGEPQCGRRPAQPGNTGVAANVVVARRVVRDRERMIIPVVPGQRATRRHGGVPKGWGFSGSRGFHPGDVPAPTRGGWRASVLRNCETDTR